MKSSGAELPDRRELAGDNANGRLWRESSYEFWRDGDSGSGEHAGLRDVKARGVEGDVDDPPSKLISQFLDKQKLSGGDVSLDMDLEMDELRFSKNNNLPSVPESPPEHHEMKIKFQPTPASTVVDIDSDFRSPRFNQQQQQQHYKSNLGPNPSGEVLKCTSNASFERKSSLLRGKTTRSRLIDPTEQQQRSERIPKSGQLKSGRLGKPMDEEEDFDPFKEEGDLPDKFKDDNFSLLIFAEWLSLVLILGALVCSLSIPLLRHRKVWELDLWKWEVLVLVLICGRLVSGWGIRIAVFFVERNFLLRKRVLYFVYGLKKAVQNCLWLGLVLLAWHFLFDKKVERETNTKVLQYVTKILVCLLVGTLLWLVKTLMVKVLASSFHVSTYFDRIQETLFNQYVIETLSGQPLIELENIKEEEDRLEVEVQKLQKAGATMPPEIGATALKSGRVIGGSGGQPKTPKTPLGKSSNSLSSKHSNKQDGGITIDLLHKLSPKNVSAWNMKRLMNIVRLGTLSTLDEQISDSTHEDDSTKHIRSEYEAKRAARKIFENVAKPGSKFMYLEDLMRFMREDEALKTLNLFEEASESRKISKASLKNWVVNAFRERRALSLTLNDTKTAVNKLHQMVNVIVGIIIGIISLVILGIATSKFFLLVSSQIVVAAFIFGNTLKTIFEALIFLFVIHPFDVGDRCEIDGVQMVVEEMNILTTVFLRYDNLKVVFCNSLLATKAIANFYRSPDMGDAVDFCIHIATPTEKIALMRQKIINYIEGKKEHWYTAPMIVLKDIEELTRLKFAVWLTHKMNHQNMGEKWTRRALLVEEMLKIFRELEIDYRMYPLDINIRTMPAVVSNRVPPNWVSGAN